MAGAPGKPKLSRPALPLPSTVVAMIAIVAPQTGRTLDLLTVSDTERDATLAAATEQHLTEQGILPPESN